MGSIDSSLATDFLSGAFSFLWAGRSLNEIAPQDTRDGMFVAEKPIYYLLGHSSELGLKSLLAHHGKDERDIKQYRHDLKTLKSECGFNLLPDFCDSIDIIADNYKNHDYRYARTFSGFSDDQLEECNKLQSVKDKTLYKRKNGLFVFSGLCISGFINTLDQQLKSISEYISK